MAPKIRRRKDRPNTWIVDYDGEGGQRRRLHARTREEAQKLLVERLTAKKEASENIEKGEGPTVAEYGQKWLELAAHEVSRRTL